MAKIDYSGRMASVYGSGRRLSPEVMETWVDAVALHLGAARGPILDLGSGTGRFSEALAARFSVPVIALEPAEGMRRQARQDVVRREVLMVGGRAEAIPVRDASFVGVWASQVVHHVDDLTACAEELRRVVRTGGPVMLRGSFDATRSFLPWGPYFPRATRIAAELFPALEEIVAVFDAAGFDLLTQEVIWQTAAGSMREYSERVRLRADSTLEMLSDEEFDAGMGRLDAVAAEEQSPVPIREAVELVVFA